MSRTLPSTVTSAVASDQTRPVYLIQMALTNTTRAATWDVNISWNGLTWTSSGIEVSNISAAGARLKIAIDDDEPWISRVLDYDKGVRGRQILIYEHHTDTTASPQADAVLIFSGIMDDVSVSDDISITCVDDSQSKGFPPASIDRPKYNYLLEPGTRIRWGPDEYVVP